MAEDATADATDPFWSGIAKLMFLGALGYVMLIFLWTAFVNFIVDEAHQPIDFYSNKLRTRPYWLIIELLLLGGVLGGVFMSGQTETLNNGLPEVAIACYLEGIVIGMVELGRVSAATSLTSMLLYTLVGPALVMVTLVPTLPLNRPGVLYGILFYLVSMIFVYVAKVGVKRHIHVDGQPKVLPAGAERLFEVWVEAVLKWNPILLCMTSMAYGVEYLQYKGEYGWACALAYWMISLLLLAGCCQQFKTGTELE